MNSWKRTIWTASIATIILINSILLLFLVVRNQVPISKEASTTIISDQPYLRTEYVLEKQKTTRSGSYLIEHYQQMEIHYDRKGNRISKQATDHQTHLRYWKPSS